MVLIHRPVQYVDRTICTCIIIQRGYIYYCSVPAQHVREQLRVFGLQVMLPEEKEIWQVFFYLPGRRGNASRGVSCKVFVGKETDVKSGGNTR